MLFERSTKKRGRFFIMRKRNIRKPVDEFLFLLGVGGSVYYGVEVLFRGFSHWSMFLLGGLCLVFCTKQGQWTHWMDPLWKQILRCMVFITSCEFMTGILVNKIFQWQIWDYSRMPGQLLGQICVPFSLIFGCLSLFGSYFGGFLSYFLYREERPKIILSQKRRQS